MSGSSDMEETLDFRILAMIATVIDTCGGPPCPSARSSGRGDGPGAGHVVAILARGHAVAQPARGGAQGQRLDPAPPPGAVGPKSPAATNP